MSLSGIISVSGLPGLHKVLSHTKNGLIVESLIDEKRRPIYSSQKVSALEDISVYTLGDDMPLKDVFKKIFDKEGGKPALNHKEKPDVLRKYLGEIVDELDNERVYNSDVAKLFQWYNLLAKKKLLNFDEEETEKKAGSKKKEAKTGDKKTEDKKTEDKKADDKKTKSAAKSKDSGAKKAPAKKAATAGKKPVSQAPKKTGGGKAASAAKSAAPARRSGRKS